MGNIGSSSNSTSNTTTKQQSSVHCTRCWNDDEQNDATQFCQDCQLPLCDDHVTLHQQTQNTNNHSLVPVDQVSKDQLPDLLEQKEIDQNLDLSLIAEEVIDYIMMPLIDAKVLHYLKCTNSQWKKRIENYAEKSVPKFKFITKFGSNGSGNGQFSCAYFVVIDKQGNIYVSDCWNHRIQIFDRNRQWLKSIGSKGSGNDQFNYPTGIAFNSKNHLFVADSDNHRIVEFDENMQFIKAFGSKGNENGQFQYPNGIAIDTDDDIVVADSDNYRIQKFSKDGNSKQTIGKEGSDYGKFYEA
jgi:hypothetical protein